MNVEKDIGSLFVNKDGCREFISAHGEVLQKLSESRTFFDILIDGSKIHEKEKSGVYTELFQIGEFMK